MYLLVVYDTNKKNCAKLHNALKRYLNWNQNSVFEGNVTEAQYVKIRNILEDKRVPDSHITLYRIESEKVIKREELGKSRGNTSNIL